MAERGVGVGSDKGLDGEDMAGRRASFEMVVLPSVPLEPVLELVTVPRFGFVS